MQKKRDTFLPSSWHSDLVSAGLYCNIASNISPSTLSVGGSYPHVFEDPCAPGHSEPAREPEKASPISAAVPPAEAAPLPASPQWETQQPVPRDDVATMPATAQGGMLPVPPAEAAIDVLPAGALPLPAQFWLPAPTRPWGGMTGKSVP